MKKGTFISSVLPHPEEEYYLHKNVWSGNIEDWNQRFEVGDVIADPSGSWSPSTAEEYIDQALSEIPVADEEDLTCVEEGNNNVLKFRNKTYNSNTYSGLGRVYLRKNMVNGVNILTQDMLYKGDPGSRIPNTNTIFIIQYDYSLNSNITIPEGCILEFEGGSISGSYTITGNNTSINAGFVRIFGVNVSLTGTWSIGEIHVEWFGAKSDGVSDCGAAFDRLNYFLDSNNTHDGIRLLKLCQGNTYLTSVPLVLKNINIDLNSACVKATSQMDALLTMVTDHTGYPGVKNMGWFRILSNGTLDANGFAESVLVTDETLLDAHSVVFKNPTVYGIRGAFGSGKTGYHRMNNIKIIMDEDKIPDNTTYAIYANVGDSVYSSFEILDFNYAIYESKNTGNTYNSIHAWIYQSSIMNSVYAHVKYFSVFINPIIDTIKTGFEVAEVFKLHINGGLGMFNASVWNSQMSGEGENNNFQFVKMLSGTVGNANVIARDFVCEGNSVPKIIISNSSNYGLVVLDNCQFYSQTVDYGKAKRVEVVREYLKQGYDPNNKNANILVTEGTYFIFDLANWSNIPNALKSKSGAIVTVERVDKVIKQTIRYAYSDVEIIEFKRTGNIENNVWSGWVFNNKQPAYLYGKDSGTTANRPVITYETLPGYYYFDTDLGKPIWWYHQNWLDADGARAGIQRNGTFANRPLTPRYIYEGFRYMINDGTNHFPVYAHLVPQGTDPETYVIEWYKADGIQYTNQ